MANNSTRIPPKPGDITPYIYTEFVSAIYLSIASPITVGANGLLLASIWKDPLKCFRTPVTYFIIGLAMVDLLTGLAVEPFFAACYFLHFTKGITYAGPECKEMSIIAGIISTIGLSTSFLIVLALSCSQFIAINIPHKYKVFITTKRVLFCVLTSVVYFTCFSLIQLSDNIPKAVFYQIDLYLHATLIPILLLISHAFVLRSLLSYAKKSQNIGNNGNTTNGPKMNGYHKEEKMLVLPKKKTLVKKSNTEKVRFNQRQLTIVTLMLSAVLLLCSLPHTIVFYLFLYKKIETFEEDLAINIALRITDDILFLKVLLDPFIYCWRLPKYRMALKNTLLCLKRQKRGSETQEMVEPKNETCSVNVK